ncbi:MAG: proliferating cell nuclear antigen [Amphiamblys sp. WSBS2006]|nr:MAG: proliferating cell nuclear antigen [Amphiamblys sp. WSBS2006]
MFEAKVQNGNILRRAIDLAKDFVSEANLDCGDNGISLTAMDSRHVTLVEFSLDRKGFENYRCDRNVSLGVNLGNLSKILKCAEQNDSIQLSADENGDKVRIAFANPDQSRTSNYTLNLMQLDLDLMAIDSKTFDATITLSASEFKKVCTDLASLGESVAISVDAEELVFTTDGEIGSGSVCLKKNEPGEKDQMPTTIECQKGKKIKQAFSLNYLAKFAKGTPFSDAVFLGIKEGAPIMVAYEQKDVGYVRFFLTPKYDEDE